MMSIRDQEDSANYQEADAGSRSKVDETSAVASGTSTSYLTISLFVRRTPYTRTPIQISADQCVNAQIQIDMTCEKKGPCITNYALYLM